MYLHLGGDCVVAQKEILGVFDLENTSLSRDTKRYLAAAEQRGEVFYVTYEMPKSFVVASRAGARRIYISQISAQTLRRRLARSGAEI